MMKIKSTLGLLVSTVVCTAGLLASAAEGVWTNTTVSVNYSPFEAAASWMNGYVPTQKNDSVTLSAIWKHTNDRAWIYSNWNASIFGNITLPAAEEELVLDDLAGYRQYRLRSSGNANDCYSFLNLSHYLGGLALRYSAALRVRAEESGATQQVHRLSVSGTPTVQVDGGVVQVGCLTGVGTLKKTGTGRMELTGVTAADGVRLKVAEGVLALKGIPASPSPTAGAAAHFDFSDNTTLTLTAGGRVTQVTDVRGGAEQGYHTLSQNFAGENNAPVPTPYGGLRLLNFDVAGGTPSLVCDTTIRDVKTLFVVYRSTALDYNGAFAFPVNSETGYELRYPENKSDWSEKEKSCYFFPDFSARYLFTYQQYANAYQCYAPFALVTGDIRRNGESVTYNATPRSFRDELEVLSINMNTNAYMGGAISNWNFRYVARAQNEGKNGGSQVGEILLYTNALTGAEQKQTLDYLMDKWGCAEGHRPYLAASVGGARGGEVYVPAGETAYVKAIDTRSGPLVKTGGGTLAVRDVQGAGAIRVKEGKITFLSGLEPTEYGAGEVQPAPGMNARFDASTTNGMTFDADGTGVLRWDSAVSNMWNAECCDYLAVTNVSETTLTGMIPFVTTVGGKQFVDFGELAVTAQGAAAPNAGWFHVGRPSSGKDNSVNHVREIFFVWKTRPAANGANPIFVGGNSDYWRYVRPGTGVMINPVNCYANSGVNNGNRLAAQAFYDAQWAVDGRLVDPTRDNFPSDVHVVRISLPTSSYFCGLGNDDYYVRGGFLMGELITYARELTDRERVDTEAYLMKKWANKTHPDYTGAAPTATHVAYDATPATLAAGTGETLQATAFAPSETIPAVLTNAAAFIHLDASDPSTMDYATATGGTIFVSKIVDPRGTGNYGAPSQSHKPKLRMNYQNGLSVLDLGQKGDGASTSTDSADLKFGTATGDGKSMIIVYSNQPESDQYANVVSVSPNWWSRDWMTGGATSFFDADGALEPQACKADIYFDGTYKGKGAASGTAMPSGFHVVAFNNGSGWGNRFAGIASKNGGTTDFGGMLFCEAWVFTNTLSTTQITAASTYLMKKWGIGGASFAEPSVATVSAAGGGTVKLGMSVNVATLAGAGTVVAPSVSGVSTIEATLQAAAVEGLTLQGTLALAANGTVRLTLGTGVRKIKAGVYPLVAGATLAADTAEKLAGWTVDAPAMRGRYFALEVADGQLCLRVTAAGLRILVR